MNWYLEALKKYATFSGRSRRKEYWMFLLISVAIFIVLAIFDGITGTMNASGIGLLTGLYWLGTLVPSIAVTVRRLHDTNHSGWWYFIVLVPLIGAIWLIVLLAQDSQSDPNEYGPSPKAAG